MADTETGTAQNEPETSGLARDWYDSVTDEEARQLGRELLQLADGGLRTKPSEGKIIVGDSVVKLWLLPDGVGREAPVHGEFKSEWIDENAENWYTDADDAVIEIAWLLQQEGIDDE